MDWYHLLTDNNNFFTSLGNIAVFVQALFFILSLYLIWRQVQEAKHQIQESVKVTKAANTQKLVELTAPFNLMLIQDSEILNLWYKADSDYDKLDQINKRRHYELLTWWLILHENIYYQWKKGYMDNDIFESWKQDLIYFFMTKAIAGHKSTWNRTFKGPFGEYIDELIASIEVKKNIGDNKGTKSESSVTTTGRSSPSNTREEQDTVKKQQKDTLNSPRNTKNQASASITTKTAETAGAQELAPSLPATPPKSLSENQAEAPPIQNQNPVSE